jgi:hypothetical protein
LKKICFSLIQVNPETFCKMKKHKWRKFEDARKFVRDLGFTRKKQWNEYCQSGNKPADIPSFPWSTYSYEWISAGDWLGFTPLESDHKQYKSFTQAREFVRSLRFKNTGEWNEYCKYDTWGNKPADIPVSPQIVYKNRGWMGMRDWLGLPKNKINKFQTYSNAQKFVRSLRLKSKKEWFQYCKSGNKPADIPSTPWMSYDNNGWTNMGTWLGIGNREWRNFKEAREFVRSLGLKNNKEWQEYCKSGNKPADIPSTPWNTYKEWKKK